MSPTERRQSIVNRLLCGEKPTMNALAEEFHVTRRTICSDIEELTLTYPIRTVRGRYGCVELESWYRPGRKILHPEQIDVLRRAASNTADGRDRQILLGILEQFSV